MVFSNMVSATGIPGHLYDSTNDFPLSVMSADNIKGKSESDQVTEYITTVYSSNSSMMVKELVTHIREGKAVFTFVRFSKYNGYATCENVNGVLEYHKRKSENAMMIQVDKIESQSKPCQKSQK